MRRLGISDEGCCVSGCEWAHVCEVGILEWTRAMGVQIYFLQSCLPAMGVSENFFFMKRDIKWHWADAVFVILKFDLIWYLHESQLRSIEQFCNLTFRKEMWYLFLCFVFIRSIEAARFTLSFHAKQYNTYFTTGNHNFWTRNYQV